MKCILHIGTEKTGTTSLQKFLHLNSALLREQGIHYSNCLGRPNNRKISVFARDADKPESGFREYGIQSEDDHRKFCGELVDQLDAEIRDIQSLDAQAIYLISNEHLHSRLISRKMVGRVHALLSNYFSSVEVFCFLRPQADLLLSQLSIGAREGNLIGAKKFNAAANSTYFNYFKLYNRWRHSFSDVKLVSYKRNPDTIDFFHKTLKFDRSACSDQPNLNTALDYRTMCLAGNLQLPLLVNGNRNKNREFYVDQMPMCDRLTVNRSEAIRVQGLFTQSNEKLCKLCPDITIADLTPDFAKYPEEGNINEIGEVNFGRQLNYMVVRFNVELWLERSRTKLAEAERARTRRNRKMGLEYLDKAQFLLENASQGEIEELRENISKLRIRATDLRGKFEKM